MDNVHVAPKACVVLGRVARASPAFARRSVRAPEHRVVRVMCPYLTHLRLPRLSVGESADGYILGHCLLHFALLKFIPQTKNLFGL
jgi:hypothetical protein